jgi:hypothetical protein
VAPGFAERLGFAAIAAAAELPQPQWAPDEARDAIREVLSRREFLAQRPPLATRLLGSIIDWLIDLLSLLTGSGGGSVLGLVVLGLILAGLAVLITRFARGVTVDPERAAALPVAPRRSATDWQAEAARREAEGDWRGGLRCRYRALVAMLGARGLVDEVPGTTAGEYRAQVGRNVPVVAGDFAGATELFELAWYGNRPTGPDQARMFGELADRVTAGSRS